MGCFIGIIFIFIYANFDFTEIGILFFIACALMGCMKVQPSGKVADTVVWATWILASVLCMLWEPFILIGSNGIYEVNPAVYVLNLLLITMLLSIALSITGKLRLSILIVSFLSMVCMTINLFVIVYRGTGIQAADLLSIGTALNVAGGYSFQFTLYMVLGWSIWVLIMFHSCSLPQRELTVRGLPKKIGLLLLAFVCFGIVSLHAPFIKIQTWGKEGMRLNGGYLNFFLSFQQSKVKQPENYSAVVIDQLEARFCSPEETEENALPDIVIVMNETFSDLSMVSDGNLKTNEDVIPFFHSFSENTVKGYALASVLGGTTPNSEYEALTGNSTAFLPYGACPFQQYIKSDSYSLTWALKNMGYHCEYTHPYLSNGWSRSKVIPYLGFETVTFLEDYPQKNLVREFVSDQEVYDFVLDKLNGSDDTPHFIFAVTMQNHGGYDYEGDNYEQTIFLNGLSQEYPEAEQYLSLVHESDRALEQFILSLEQREKDTVVLFFGDHLPGLSSEFYEDLFCGKSDSLEEKMKMYTVPFFVWANYDIEEQEIPLTSLNYLTNYLLEAANIPLPPYNQFLKAVQEKIPAINLYGYYSVAEGGFLEISEAAGAEKEWLDAYMCLQYNSMFDRKNVSDLFFNTKSNNNKG